MRGKKPKERQRYVLRVNETLVEVTRDVYLAWYQSRRKERYQLEKMQKNGVCGIEKVGETSYNSYLHILSPEEVYHRAYYSLEAYSWLENYALEHSRSPEDILLEREEMTTRLHLIAALPVALAHATPTQARRVHAYYIAGIKQPEISRREGVHSSKVSVSIRRGLRNMRRCYDDLFQTE